MCIIQVQSLLWTSSQALRDFIVVPVSNPGTRWDGGKNHRIIRHYFYL